MDDTRINKLLTFLTQDGHDPFILYALATEYNSRGDNVEALSYYLRLINEHPEYVGTYYHLGKLYERLGTGDIAIETYKNGMLMAKQKGDSHAFSELQGAYNKAAGLDYEDD